MKKWTLPIASVVLILMSTPPARAQQSAQTAAKAESAKFSDNEKNLQAYISLLRADVRKRKAEVMGAVMQLDAEDAVAFWPIYRDFETDLRKLYDQLGVAIRKYAAEYENMTDPIADQLATQVLDLEQQRNNIKRRYYTRFKTALDAIVAMRFLQVENQLERIIDLQIASELPVVERGQKERGQK
jgi:hypothetical protein